MAPEVMVVNLKQNAPLFLRVWHVSDLRLRNLDMKTKTEIFVVTVQQLVTFSGDLVPKTVFK